MMATVTGRPNYIQYRSIIHTHTHRQDGTEEEKKRKILQRKEE